MFTSRIKLAPLVCGTLFAANLPAQKLQWAKPSLVELPPARSSAPMAYDSDRHSILLFGGSTYSTTFDDTWEFSRNGWKQLVPSSSPPALTGLSLAYDPLTKTVVLFGGQTVNASSSETWLWDGVTWTQQFPPVSPSARTWNTNGMAFDPAIGKVVLFGGFQFDFAGIMNDTWEWDGQTKTWSEKFPVHKPAPRYATVTYDAATKMVMLFGGAAPGSIYYGDTWTYNGVDWTQQQPTTVPPARCDNVLAFDPTLGKVILFGGLAGSCEVCGEMRLNDTWAWDGRNWTQAQTSSPPTPRSGFAFTFDATANAMLLFGGWVSDSQFTSGTWFERSSGHD